MIYGLITLGIGIILCIITYHIDIDFLIACSFTVAILGFAISIGIPIASVVDYTEITSAQVEWSKEDGAFRQVEVSNTTLKVYEHRNWFTYKVDGERYSIIEKGDTVLAYVKYDDVIKYYSPKENSLILGE